MVIILYYIIVIINNINYIKIENCYCVDYEFFGRSFEGERNICGIFVSWVYVFLL